MLDDLDETFKALFRERGRLDANEIDVAFEAPDREWSARISKPTVNCYLYDIRENLQLRETDWLVERQENGRLATKRQPPRRFDMSYLCTAWTSDVEDEHRLLWRVLATLIRHPVLPREVLHGALAQTDYPISTQIAQPGTLRNPAEVWSALDNRIRPSVNVIATVPLDDMEPIDAPVTLTKRLRLGHVTGPTEELIQIAGTVRDAEGGPQRHALIRVRDHAYATIAGADGRFWLTGLPAGEYTLVAEFDGRRGERLVRVPGEGYDLTLDRAQAERAIQDGGAPARKRKRRTS